MNMSNCVIHTANMWRFGRGRSSRGEIFRAKWRQEMDPREWDERTEALPVHPRVCECREYSKYVAVTFGERQTDPKVNKPGHEKSIGISCHRFTPFERKFDLMTHMKHNWLSQSDNAEDKKYHVARKIYSIHSIQQVGSTIGLYKWVLSYS